MLLIRLAVAFLAAPPTTTTTSIPASHFSGSSIAGLPCPCTSNSGPPRRLGFVFRVLFRGVTSVGCESDQILTLPPHLNNDSARTVNEGHSDVNREVVSKPRLAHLTALLSWRYVSRVARSVARSCAISGHSSAWNVIATARTGCTSPSDAACSACRPISAVSLGRGCPYTASPRMGWPRAARCTRI